MSIPKWNVHYVEIIRLGKQWVHWDMQVNDFSMTVHVSNNQKTPKDQTSNKQDDKVSERSI